MQQQADGSGQEPLTLAQAVREAKGRISYQQLWKAIRAGRVEAFQSSGPGGSYKIRRSELETLVRPVAPTGSK